MLLQTGDEKRWLADHNRALRPNSIDAVMASTNRTEHHWNRPIAGFFAGVFAALIHRACRATLAITKLTRKQPARAKPVSAASIR